MQNFQKHPTNVRRKSSSFHYESFNEFPLKFLYKSGHVVGGSFLRCQRVRIFFNGILLLRIFFLMSGFLFPPFLISFSIYLFLFDLIYYSEVFKALNKTRGLYLRWRELGENCNSAEAEWTTNELRNSLRSIEWDLEDLEDTINILFKLTKRKKILCHSRINH